MSAVEKVRDHALKAGRYIAPDDLPFELVLSDYHYESTRHGHRSRYILKVEIVEATQTPRSEYVEVVCEFDNDEGIEAPEEWSFALVEKKTVTKTEYVRKK